jgi:hypothetical protein
MSTSIEPENMKPSVAAESPKSNASKELSLRQISQKDFERNWSLFLLQEAKPLQDLKATNEKTSLLAKSYLEEKTLLESKLNTQLTINQELQKEVHDQLAVMTCMQIQIDRYATHERLLEERTALQNDLLKIAEEKATAHREIIERQLQDLEAFRSSGLGHPDSVVVMVDKLHAYAHMLDVREQMIKDLRKGLADSEKTIRDLERSVRNIGRREQDLTEKLALKDKRLEEVEGGIRAQIRDVKLREDAVKERELKIKEQQRRIAAPTELMKEASKELKTAKAQWEKQLRESEQKIDHLEQRLKDLMERYDILQLDYDAAVSNRQNVDGESDNVIVEKLRILEEDRDHFKRLYEANRSSEKLIQHRIAQAVRIAESRQNATFSAWKAKQKDVILEADRKLAAAEAKAKAAEKRVSSIGFSREARISEILDRMDESIKELSRAKMSLLDENMDKDAEIELLKERLSSLVLGKEKE